MLERLKVYHRQTEPLVEYYRARPTFRSIDGAQAPDRVAADLAAAIAAAGNGAGARERAVIVCRSAAELEQDARGRPAGRRSADRARRARRAGRDDGGSRRAGGEADPEGGREPAFKGYHGYPATICASVNEEVIHGIPSGRRLLNDGDIISIDIGATLDGYFGDSAVTVPVGHGVGGGGDAAAGDRRVALQGDRARCRPGGAGLGHRRTRCRQHVEALRVFGGARVRRPRHRRSSCTRSRRCRTTASRAAGRGWPRAWCWRSSRW